jgi:hypothetical protein
MSRSSDAPETIDRSGGRGDKSQSEREYVRLNRVSNRRVDEVWTENVGSAVSVAERAANQTMRLRTSNLHLLHICFLSAFTRRPAFPLNHSRQPEMCTTHGSPFNFNVRVLAKLMHLGALIRARADGVRFSRGMLLTFNSARVPPFIFASVIFERLCVLSSSLAFGAASFISWKRPL